MDIKAVTAETGAKTDGAWIEYPDANGVSFKLGYTGNDDYQDYLVERMARARRGRRDIPAAKARAIVVDAMVKFILKDWKGLTSDGKPYEFSADNARTFLLGSAIIRDFIASEASSIDNFGTGDEEEEPEETAAGALKSVPAVVA